MTKNDYPELQIYLDKILTHKEENGLSYDDLGRALGCSRSHLQRVLTGQTLPSVQLLIELSRFMGIPLSELFSKED